MRRNWQVPYGCPLDSIDAKRELGFLIQLFFMSTFPFFRLVHTDTYNDSDMGSLLLHSPWEALHEPTIITPPICWQFDHQQLPTTDNVVLDEQTRSQFGFMHEKYYHHQSPWILPVKSSELQLCGQRQINTEIYTANGDFIEHTAEWLQCMIL
jgi:hypothetical protein